MKVILQVPVSLNPKVFIVLWMILKEETDRTGSILKAELHLGPDYEL